MIFDGGDKVARCLDLAQVDGDAVERDAAGFLEQVLHVHVARIFGKRHSVIDRIDQLPQRLPELFVALTK